MFQFLLGIPIEFGNYILVKRKFSSKMEFKGNPAPASISTLDEILEELLSKNTVQSSNKNLTLERKPAGAELCQAQVKLEVGVEFVVELKACHY